MAATAQVSDDLVKKCANYVNFVYSRSRENMEGVRRGDNEYLRIFIRTRGYRSY